MKMVYIANVRIPTEKAHGIQIMKMCEAFANAGIDLELVVPKRRNAIIEDPFLYYGVKQNFKITRLFTLDFIGLVPRIGFFIESLTFFISAKRYLQKRDFTVIYTREYFTGLFFKKIILELHNIPRIMTSLFRYVVKNRISKLVIITQALKKAVLDIGINGNNVLVASDGVDLQKFALTAARDDARLKLNLPLHKKLALYAGHLFHWKGAQTLADATDFFPDDYIAVFVGGTNRDIKNFNLKNKHRIKVYIIGMMPYNTIPFFLRAADALILPNTNKSIQSRSYTSPMKLFEYMASGRPIVASDIPAVREILNDSNARFVKPDDPKSLAEGITSVIDNPDYSQTIARKARQDVLKYSWDKRALHIMQFIEQSV